MLRFGVDEKSGGCGQNQEERRGDASEANRPPRAGPRALAAREATADTRNEARRSNARSVSLRRKLARMPWEQAAIDCMPGTAIKKR